MLRASIIIEQRLPLHFAALEYGISEEFAAHIKIGQLVRVPFRNKIIYGVVQNIFASPSTGARAVKKLIEITREESFFSKEQVAFVEEFSSFYHTPLGSVLKMCLPPLQKKIITNWKKITLLSPLTTKKNAHKPIVFSPTSQQTEKEYLLSQLSAPGQHLVLLPEINAAAKICEFLSTSNFFSRISLLTSETKPAEVGRIWLSVRSGEEKIIIGTRRALFLPWQTLKNIFLLDEGNPMYKSWDMAPRFHTRDAVFLINQYIGHPQIHLISPTPSVETTYFSQKKVYLQSTEPAHTKNIQSKKPTLHVVNLNDERNGGNYSLITDTLVETILSPKPGSVFLFLNQRGSSRQERCLDCGLIARCPNCQSALILFKNSGRLSCRLCTFSKPSLLECPNCQSSHLKSHGVGTEWLEQELRKTLPSSFTLPIIRIDQEENELKKNTFSSPALIIGTQQAWSSLPWHALRAFIFVDADTSLYIPEYRVHENLWQLLNNARTQLSSSAEIFIQTNHPDYTIFKGLNQPELFYTQELAQRKTVGYPPFNFLLKLSYGHPNEASAKQEANHLYEKLIQLTKDTPEIRITPPSPSLPRTYQQLFWRVLIIKIGFNKYKFYTKMILNIVPPTWKVDPNPNQLLYLN